MKLLDKNNGDIDKASLPLWERGLKYGRVCDICRDRVASLVGAWIEISIFCIPFLISSSLPLWERGLKYTIRY